MLFNSLEFIVFLVVVLAIYQVLPDEPRKYLLLAGSYFFYGCWDYRFLSLLAISTVVDFFCAKAIVRSSASSHRKRYLFLSLAVNLGFLLYFKYCNFFIGSASDLLSWLGIPTASSTLSIILPVGISFYTFQTLSYTIDVYRGQLKPTSSLLDFACYVAFFPQLVAGPIERASRFLPQFATHRAVSEDQVLNGIWLILLGFVKKLVIADRCAAIVNSAFEGSSLPYQNPGDWLFLYAFAFQIYGDFSGYTDIARGVAKLLGYELMVNFRNPFLVSNPSDFWSNWHISLSTWLRDYLYIPLGGNRGGRIHTYRNLMLTMLLGGMWHGAGWAYIIWGAYQGVLLVVHRAIKPYLATTLGALTGIPGGIVKLFTWLVFFHLVCVGWLLFRAGSLPPEQNQIAFLQGSLDSLFAFGRTITIYDWPVLRTLLLLGVVTLALQWRWEEQENFAGWSLPWQAFSVVSAASAILVFGVFEGAEFIYFQF